MKVVVFDLDETLGYFSQFGQLWNELIPNKDIDFNELFDLYPEFLRPNIWEILQFLNEKKKKKLVIKFCYIQITKVQKHGRFI